MAAIDPDSPYPRLTLKSRLHHWLMSRVASPSFQGWAAQFPLTRRTARKDGERLFDLVSGFAYSQTLLAVVELELLEKLQMRAQTPAQLAFGLNMDAGRVEILCQAAAALDLIDRQGDGSYRIARLGAATLGVPGLRQMIRHHSIFYRDLQDPVALLRGETDPELARFWPYVNGETARDIPAETAGIYSDLMAQSQTLVAEETLRTVNLSGVAHLLDVGGGTGAFAKAVRAQNADVKLTVFDLPPVINSVQGALRPFGITGAAGSFHNPLPAGADAISLIRVLYDHSDQTIQNLFENIYSTLPSGGRLLISEPMSGGDSPTRSGDVYFSLYTLAMTTGKARSSQEIQRRLSEIGFENIVIYRNIRPFVTSCITAQKP